MPVTRTALSAPGPSPSVPLWADSACEAVINGDCAIPSTKDAYLDPGVSVGTAPAALCRLVGEALGDPPHPPGAASSGRQAPARGAIVSCLQEGTERTGMPPRKPLYQMTGRNLCLILRKSQLFPLPQANRLPRGHWFPSVSPTVVGVSVRDRLGVCYRDEHGWCLAHGPSHSQSPAGTFSPRKCKDTGLGAQV